MDFIEIHNKQDKKPINGQCNLKQGINSKEGKLEWSKTSFEGLPTEKFLDVPEPIFTMFNSTSHPYHQSMEVFFNPKLDTTIYNANSDELTVNIKSKAEEEKFLMKTL